MNAIVQRCGRRRAHSAAAIVLARSVPAIPQAIMNVSAVLTRNMLLALRDQIEPSGAARSGLRSRRLRRGWPAARTGWARGRA
jgi:hypothetical protein